MIWAYSGGEGLYIKDITVDKMESLTNSRQIGCWFRGGVSKLNINQTNVLSGFQAVGHGSGRILNRTCIPHTILQCGGNIYLSDFGERELGNWLVLWGVTTPPEQAKCVGNFYISGFEGKGREEEQMGLTMYGVEPYELLEKEGEYHLGMVYPAGTEMRINADAGAVSIMSLGGQIFSVGISIRSVSDEIKLPEGLEKRLEELSRLPEKWDSYNASRISDEAIEKAKSVLVNVARRYGGKLLEEAFIAPCSDGGLQLEWSLESEKALILRITSSRELASFLLVEPSGKEASMEKEGTIRGVKDENRLFDELVKAEGLR